MSPASLLLFRIILVSLFIGKSVAVAELVKSQGLAGSWWALTLLALYAGAAAVLWQVLPKDSREGDERLAELRRRAEEEITERESIEREAANLGLPFVEINRLKIDPGLLEKFDPNFLREHQCLPVKQSGNQLWLAMADVNDTKTQDLIREQTKCRIHPVKCVPKQLEEYLDGLVSISPK